MLSDYECSVGCSVTVQWLLSDGSMPPQWLLRDCSLLSDAWSGPGVGAGLCKSALSQAATVMVIGARVTGSE